MMALDSQRQPRSQIPATDAQVSLGKAQEFYRQGSLTKALEYVAAATEACNAESAVEDYLNCLLLEGRIRRDQSDFEKALSLYKEAQVLAEKRHLSGFKVEALNLTASVMRYQGDNQQAIELLQEAHAMALKEGLTQQIAHISNNIGNLFLQAGDYPNALQYLTEANNRYREIAKDSPDSAVNHLTLGGAYLDLGEYNKAQSFLEKALDISQEARSPNLVVVAFNNLAEVYVKQKLWSSAQNYYQQALQLAQSLGAKHYVIDNLDGLGLTLSAMGNYEEARHYHQQALEIAREIEDHEGEKDALINLGKTYQQGEQLAEARYHLQSALHLAEKLGHKRSVFECHQQLSAIYKQQGDFQQALEHHEAFHSVERSIFNEQNEEKTRQLTVKFDLERVRRDAEEYKLRSQLAQQAKKQAEAIIKERTQDLENAQLEIVTRLAVAAEYRDDDTGEHTRRVGRNAAAIAYVLDWPEDQVKLIYLAARLHDIGKIGIKDGILLKPGKLTDDEFELMRTHTVIGARILAQGASSLLQLAEQIALSHHERWDGRGYPYRLAGEDIPLAARIVSVADVLDALTHERPYKRAWSVEETLEEIQKQSGSQFDPQIVEACMSIFDVQQCSPLEAPDSWRATLAELHTLDKLSH